MASHRADNQPGRVGGVLHMDAALGSLASFELFSGLSADAVSEIEGRCSWFRFGPGEQVFDRDSDTLDVYFIVSGAVRISAQQSEDNEVPLADVVAGNYFGELAAIDGMGRSARVVATRESVLASLDRPSFLEFLRRHPEISVKVLSRLTRIIRNLDHRVTQLSTQNESQRIWAELVRLAEPDPGRPDGWHIPDLPNHKEIAAWAGTSREAVAQAIGELARNGVVKRRGIGLVISDWSRLQLMAKDSAA